MSELLLQHLAQALADAPPASLCVALSGGADSSALLHALARLPAARARGLRALHVDHGLHAHSGAWAKHCQDFCQALGIPCEVKSVKVALQGHGPEAAARHARYEVFAAHLGLGERLLLAHHRDDQVETVLLKLLRGAGPEGLGGMRTLRPLGQGQLWRPLLKLSRHQLQAYVDAWRLSFIQDPSNQDERYARNYLRHDILPRLTRHWPQAVDSIIHSAALSRAAADTLRNQWIATFYTLHDSANGSLDANGWLALQPALRGPLLDHWLHIRGFSAPTAAQRRQIERQCHARAGQQPCIRWANVALHIWKGRLWAVSPRSRVSAEWQSCWYGERLPLPDGGTLSLGDGDVGRLMQALVVRLRRGGERIRPAGDAHTRELRDLFQQGRVPPWERAHCPLIYADNELIAVADLWISARGMAIFQQVGAHPNWLSAC